MNRSQRSCCDGSNISVEANALHCGLTTGDGRTAQAGAALRYELHLGPRQVRPQHAWGEETGHALGNGIGAGVDTLHTSRLVSSWLRFGVWSDRVVLCLIVSC